MPARKTRLEELEDELSDFIAKIRDEADGLNDADEQEELHRFADYIDELLENAEYVE